MLRTNSTIWSRASGGGLMTTSTPSPSTLRSKSVTSAATSIRASACEVEAGHLAVDPDESVSHNRSPYPWRSHSHRSARPASERTAACCAGPDSLARLVVGGVWLWAGLLKIGDPAASVTAVRGLPAAARPRWPSRGARAADCRDRRRGLSRARPAAPRPAALSPRCCRSPSSSASPRSGSRGISIDCGCFGDGGPDPDAIGRYPWEIARDVGLLLAVPAGRLGPAYAAVAGRRALPRQARRTTPCRRSRVRPAAAERAAAVRQQQASRERHRRLAVIAAVVVLLLPSSSAPGWLLDARSPDTPAAAGPLPPASAQRAGARRGRATTRRSSRSSSTRTSCAPTAASSSPRPATSCTRRPTRARCRSSTAPSTCSRTTTRRGRCPRGRPCSRGARRSRRCASTTCSSTTSPTSPRPASRTPTSSSTGPKQAGVSDSDVLAAVREGLDTTFVDAADAAAEKAGVSGTPTVFVNGKELQGTSVSRHRRPAGEDDLRGLTEPRREGGSVTRGAPRPRQPAC